MSDSTLTPPPPRRRSSRIASALRRLAIEFILWIRGPRILASAREDFAQAWPDVSWVFRNAHAVFAGPVGVGAIWYLEAKLLEAARENRSDAEGLFSQNVTCKDAMVAAYCILGLGRIRSSCLADAALQLVGRKEVVLYRAGCFGNYLSLGMLARIIDFNYGQGAPLENFDAEGRDKRTPSD